MTAAQLYQKLVDRWLSAETSKIDPAAPGTISPGQRQDLLEQTYLALAAVSSAAWHPDGELLATSTGRSVVLWDLSAGVPVTVLAGHTASVAEVAFSPDGTRLTSTGKDLRITDLGALPPVRGRHWRLAPTRRLRRPAVIPVAIESTKPAPTSPPSPTRPTGRCSRSARPTAPSRSGGPGRTRCRPRA